MTLRRGMLVILAATGVAMLRVAQQHAIINSAYAVGDRTKQLYAQHTDVSWLSLEVGGLASPAHLSTVKQQQRLPLVARTTFVPSPRGWTDAAARPWLRPPFDSAAEAVRETDAAASRDASGRIAPLVRAEND